LDRDAEQGPENPTAVHRKTREQVEASQAKVKKRKPNEGFVGIIPERGLVQEFNGLGGTPHQRAQQETGERSGTGYPNLGRFQRHGFQLGDAGKRDYQHAPCFAPVLSRSQHVGEFMEENRSDKRSEEAKA
jgi:hypothetical protein